MKVLFTIIIFFGLLKITFGQGEEKINFVNKEIKKYLNIKEKVNLFEECKPSIIGQLDGVQSDITEFLLTLFDTSKVNEILINDSSLQSTSWTNKISFVKKYFTNQDFDFWLENKISSDLYKFNLPAFDNEKKICVFTYDKFSHEKNKNVSSTIIFMNVNSKWVFYRQFGNGQ
jgi:hypothetical protein